MLIAVDPATAQPLFDQIAGAIRLAVVRGEVAPGERLPAARGLAESLNLNVNTVLHAYRALRDEGLIELHRGRGATVRARTARDYQQLHLHIAAARAEANRLGVSTATLAAMLTEEDS